MSDINFAHIKKTGEFKNIDLVNLMIRCNNSLLMASIKLKEMTNIEDTALANQILETVFWFDKASEKPALTDSEKRKSKKNERIVYVILCLQVIASICMAQNGLGRDDDTFTIYWGMIIGFIFMFLCVDFIIMLFSSFLTGSEEETALKEKTRKYRSNYLEENNIHVSEKFHYSTGMVYRDFEFIFDDNSERFLIFQNHYLPIVIPYSELSLGFEQDDITAGNPVGRVIVGSLLAETTGGIIAGATTPNKVRHIDYTISTYNPDRSEININFLSEREKTSEDSCVHNGIQEVITEIDLRILSVITAQ